MTVARTLAFRLDTLARRATSLAFAAVVTVALLGGIDALATAPAAGAPLLAQAAVTAQA